MGGISRTRLVSFFVIFICFCFCFFCFFLRGYKRNRYYSLFQSRRPKCYALVIDTVQRNDILILGTTHRYYTMILVKSTDIYSDNYIIFFTDARLVLQINYKIHENKLNMESVVCFFGVFFSGNEAKEKKVFRLRQIGYYK